MSTVVDDIEEREEPLEDESGDEPTVAPVQYDISSYGADYDVEGLVKRIQRDDILIPPFQRNYVWTQKDASRFIESLLLAYQFPKYFLLRSLTQTSFLCWMVSSGSRLSNSFMKGTSILMKTTKRSKYLN